MVSVVSPGIDRRKEEASHCVVPLCSMLLVLLPAKNFDTFFYKAYRTVQMENIAWWGCRIFVIEIKRVTPLWGPWPGLVM